MKKLHFSIYALSLLLVTCAHARSEKENVVIDPEVANTLTMVKAIGNRDGLHNPAAYTAFDELSDHLENDSMDIPYNVVCAGLSEAVDMLDKSKGRLDKNFYEQARTVLQGFLKENLSSRASSCPSCQTCCVLNPQPGPVCSGSPICPPCNTCVQPCLLSGTFTIDDMGNKIDQVGTDFCVIKTNTATQFGALAKVYTIIPVCLQANCQLIPQVSACTDLTAGPVQQPLLFGCLSNRKFQILAFLPNAGKLSTISFIAACPT